MNSTVWNPVLKIFLLNSVFASPVNNARDPPFFNKIQKHMFNVRSKRTLNVICMIAKFKFRTTFLFEKEV